MIPAEVSEWLQQKGDGEVVQQSPVGGGCINNGLRIQTSSGSTFFLKTNHSAPVDMFTREAEGLHALSRANALRVPDAFLWGVDYILMEDLAPGALSIDYWLGLGHGLALLHGHTSPRFGFEHDNYLGSTSQVNTWNEDGYAFFAEQRLGFQARLARDNERLSSTEVAQIELLASRLPQLVPLQAPALLHGDLWAGNAVSDSRGQPALIDPAAHYGWPEAELGMTALFGGFDPRFYSAYEEVRHLEPGWRKRLPMYNLYHLLNHLNLFGAGYHAQLMDTVARFT